MTRLATPSQLITCLRVASSSLSPIFHPLKRGRALHHPPPLYMAVIALSSRAHETCSPKVGCVPFTRASLPLRRMGDTQGWPKGFSPQTPTRPRISLFVTTASSSSVFVLESCRSAQGLNISYHRSRRHRRDTLPFRTTPSSSSKHPLKRFI